MDVVEDDSSEIDFFWESKIFRCIHDGNVEGLKLFMNYWNYRNIFQIEDFDGYTILQTAISENKIAVFDFLLSLDGYPINAENTRGQTALEIALKFSHREGGEYFINALLTKGGNIEKLLSFHRVLDYHNIKVAKLFIKQGADLNCYNQYGETPLHRIRYLDGDKNEWFAMMLYFGADPSIPNREGYTVIDFAFQYDYLSESMLEHLIFHVFDDYCTDYQISLDNLFGLLQSNYSFAPQVLKQITSVNVDKNHGFGCFAKYFKTLFTMKPEYLKFLLERFDYVIENIIDNIGEYSYIYYPFSNEMFTENFDLLLQSQFSSDVIQMINKKIRISELIIQSQQSNVPKSELFETVMIMLSYGADINYDEMEKIYKIFGDCEFFRILLHIDKKQANVDLYMRNTVPYLLHNIHLDVEIFISVCMYNYCSREAMEDLLNHFAHPKLKSYCYSRPRIYHEIFPKVENLPSVPLLVELARNKVRTFLIQKYKIKNSVQFYTLIKHLPISKVYEKIITFETKLYENYHK